jgi:hypothetical protein
MQEAGAADGAGDVEMPLAGWQAGEGIPDRGAQVTDGIGFGVQLLQRPISFDGQGEALFPLQQTPHQGSAGGETAESDRRGRVGPLPPPGFLDQIGGDGSGGTQGAVGGEDADPQLVKSGA